MKTITLSLKKTHFTLGLLLISFLFANNSSAQTTTVTITTTGAGTWTVPVGVSGSITVEVWGAGGSGGGCTASKSKGGSGGTGGTYSRSVFTGVVAGTTYYLNVAPATTGTSGANGTNGGNSWFNTTNTSGTLVANGGLGGDGGDGGAKTAVTTGSIGTTIIKGGDTLAGGSATGSAGGAGGSASGGAGGSATTAGNNSQTTGNAGTAAGGGGSGASTGAGGGGDAVAGGTGAQGQIRITYANPACTTPTAQPTTLTFGTITGTSIAGSFTAASPSPTNYLVIANTTGTTPTPTNGTSYTIGSTVLGGTNVIVDNDTNNSFSNTGLTGATKYYYYIFSFNTTTCSGGPTYFTGTPLTGNTSTLISYCIPTASSGVDGTGITNVSFSSVNYASTNTTVYNDHTSQTGNVAQGATMPISVTTNTGKKASNIKIWVDWNNDGDFTDSGEEMFSGIVTSTTITGNILIPSTAIVGNHRMRVGITQGQGNENSNNYEAATPCFTGSKGAFEDYTINVSSSSLCTLAPTVSTNPSSVTIPNNSNTSFTATFANSPTSYVWEVSTDGGINFTTITNGGVYSTATTATLTLTSATSSMNDFKYRVSASNACGTSPVSTGATLNFNTVTYCDVSSTTAPSTYYISNFESTGNLLDTANTSNSYSTNGYGDFTAIKIATQIPGGGANFSINVSPFGTTFDQKQRVSCFVDWNSDGVFADPGERVYTSNGISIQETTFGFEIPFTTNPGNYRMRVRTMRPTAADGVVVTSCTKYTTGGETEDYTLAVVRDCAAQIQNVSNASVCGINNTVTLGAVGIGGTLEYRWYITKTGGSPIAITTTGTWTTPTLPFTTAYYVTSFNGNCESLVRTKVIATIIPSTTIYFDPANPTTCGENNVITINAAGDTTVIDLFNEDFEGTTYGLTGTVTGTGTGSDTPWSVKTNTYPTTSTIWKPAISSGTIGTKFALTSSDYVGANLVTQYTTTNVINTTDFIDLTLTFRHYFSYYPAPTINYGNVQVSFDVGNTTWFNVGVTYGSDTGVASKFVDASIDLTPYIGKTNLKFRFQYTANYADGWAIDDIRLFGTKQLYTTFTWSAATPVAAFTDYACTNPYVAQKVNIIYLKPDLSQLETSTFPITVNATLGNGCPVSQTITVANNTKVWRGDIPGMSDTTSEWNDPNNWKPYGVPTASNCVVAPENTIISGTNYNAYAKNVVVKSTGTFELQAGNNLTVTDWIRVEDGGVFNVKNNASIVQINDNQNTGRVNIERITQPMNYYDYTYWNSPVTLASNFTLGSLSNLTTSEIWSYSPTVSGGSGNWIKLSSSTVMNPSKGYIVKAPDTFSNNTKLAYTANFIGTPNNGPILAPISKGSDSNLGGLVNVEDDEWNLIGNPYPSGLDAKKFLDLPANTNIVDGTIYIWTHITAPSATAPDQFYGDYVLNYTSDDYASFNKTGGTGTASSATNGGNAPTGFIATGQSFFIKAAAVMPHGTNNAVATFNNSMRIAGKNSDFFKTRNPAKGTTAEEKHRIWLNLTNNAGAFSQTLIGYITDATQGLDRGFDGESFGGNDVTFYSIIPEANLTIQGRALPFDASDKVALGYNAAKKGNYSIRIDHLDGIFDSQDIYLEDKELNVIHNLKQKPYIFNTNVGDFDNRFVLRYSDKTLKVDDNTLESSDLKITHVQNGNILLISNILIDSAVEKVILFNVLGQSISSWKIENQDQQNIQIPLKNLSSGIYVAKIKTSNGDFSKKIIIP